MLIVKMLPDGRKEVVHPTTGIGWIASDIRPLLDLFFVDGMEIVYV